MKLEEHKPIICPKCSSPLTVHPYNKVVQKRADGKDWAEMWCDKCMRGYDSVKPPKEKKKSIW